MINNIRDIGNEDVTSRVESEVLLSFLGMNSKGVVDIYTLLFSTKEPITGFSLDNIKTSNFDVNYVKGSSGNIVSTTTLDEQDPSSELNITIYEDYNFITNDNVDGFKNILNSILKGTSIVVNDEIITILGTNGTKDVSRGRTKYFNTDRDFKGAYSYEGSRLRIAGGVKEGRFTYKPNFAIRAWDQLCKTVGLEVRTLSGGGVQNCKFVPYLKCNSMVLNEGDVNQYDLQFTRLSDVWERADFFTEEAEVHISKQKRKDSEFEVDYIGFNKPLRKEVGEIICLIDKSSGMFIFEEFDGNRWVRFEELHIDLDKYSRIFSKRIVLPDGSLEFTNAIAVVGYDVDVNGINEISVTYDEDTPQTYMYTNSSNEGYLISINGSDQFFYRVYNYNRDTQRFEKYSTYYGY